MMNEIWIPTDAEIVSAREKLFRGYNDLGTEQALKWFLGKHPHPLNQVLDKCTWCLLERKSLESIHCATKCSEEAWWKEMMETAQKERDEIYREIGGFCFGFIRVGLPDGRWWYLRVIDSKKIDGNGWMVKERQ